MIIQARSFQSLLFLLLIAAALPSCKSPTATTQPSAFTLILPDSTVAWGDSAMMRVVSSKPLSSSSVYIWTFGDSSSLVSRNDTIIHYYPDTGVFTVKVDLNDTSNQDRLGIQSGMVHVAARHFNLGLLQSMKYVDVSWNAFVDTIITGSPLAGACGAPGSNENIIVPLSWTGTGFSMSADTSYTDSIPGELEAGFGSESIGEGGSFDLAFTQITNFSQNLNDVSFSGQERVGNFFCYSTYGSSLSIGRIPFKSASDSDMIFEAFGMVSKNGAYQSTIYGRGNGGEHTIQYNGTWTEANPSFIPYIRIHFHK